MSQMKYNGISDYFHSFVDYGPVELERHEEAREEFEDMVKLAPSPTLELVAPTHPTTGLGRPVWPNLLSCLAREA